MTAALLGSISIAARDPGSTRLVYAIVISLVAIGVGLVVLTWWLVRTTRPDPELLAPLEAMQSRRWRRLDPADRRRLLDDLRPDGAEPAIPAQARPVVDDEFADDPAMRDVRELADPAERHGPRRRVVPPVTPASPAGPESRPSSAPVGGVVGEVGLARSTSEPEDDAADGPADPEVDAVWGVDGGVTRTVSPGPEPEAGVGHS